MTGMDSLLVAVPTKLAALPALLDRYLVKFEDEAYKKTFPWVGRADEMREHVDLSEQLPLEILRRQRVAHRTPVRARDLSAGSNLLESASISFSVRAPRTI